MSILDENKTIKENMDSICEMLEEEIEKLEEDVETKEEMLDKLHVFSDSPTNIMLVGATGCGKSSTINALFADTDDVEVAKVGSKADPETMDIEKYTIGNLVLWDTPGLGDGTEIDEHHKKVIQELLEEEDEDGNALIDLVLVILDGSTRDLGTSYKILNDVIIPELEDEEDRILIALNQSDIAMKTGRHWDYEKNEPDETLLQFLNDKVESIQARIYDEADLDVEPVFYCAGYKEESGEVVYPYNLSKLLYYILNALPSEKRISVLEGINTDSDNYQHNDDEEEYASAIKGSATRSFGFIVSDAIDVGVEIGSTVLGIPGAIAGAIIGVGLGCIHGIMDGIFG